jgi:thiol-disulfide isomerase/thioredoxin
MTVATPEAPQAPLPSRKPRKIFLVVGLVVAVFLGIGLFTSIGTNNKSGAPQAGNPVPSFTSALVIGSGTVRVRSEGGTSGRPTVLLFFGHWCQICLTELPSLAATVRSQDAHGGPLSRIRVIGVDSEDPLSVARSFVASSGVTFPVANDQDAAIMNNKFLFNGDPYAVFVNGDGIIDRVVASRISPKAFTAYEKALIPSGS